MSTRVVILNIIIIHNDTIVKVVKYGGISRMDLYVAMPLQAINH